ncbi:MAG TPA: EF-hand domain-containing protein [Phytomonospora sp.]
MFEYSRLFDLVDTDGNGEVTARDMTALGERVIAAFGGAATPAKTEVVRSGFTAYWSGLAAPMGGGDGPFTREQFTDGLTKAVGRSEQGFDSLLRPLAEAIFALCDTDDSGVISLAEFQRAESAMGVPTADSERIFRLIDANGDGDIDSGELVAAVADFYRNPSADSPMSDFFGSLGR